MGNDVLNSPIRQADVLIARADALAVLEAAELGQLTLLIAPHGYGKSCLLSSYHQQLLTIGKQTRWLSISAHDNSFGRLQQRLNSFFLEPTADLNNAVSPEQWHGFIDGLEAITEPQALALVDSYFETLPTNARLFATGSGLYSANLHEARLRGVLNVLDVELLAMSHAEAAAVLGEQWQTTEIERLNRFVGGWSAGLRFLARAPHQAKQQLKCTDDSTLYLPEMADYFFMVFCQPLAPQELQALMELSVLQRFSAAIIAEAPALHCNWHLIEHWLRAGLLLHYVDSSRDWVAFQPAFGCYLRQRLRQHQPARYDEIKQFSATWFEQHGFSTDAVRQAVGLKQVQLAAQIIEKAGAISVAAGDAVSFEIPQNLTPEQVVEFPLLYLEQIYHQIRHGRIYDAQRDLDRARQLTKNFTQLHDSANKEIVQAWAIAIDVIASVTQDIRITKKQINQLQSALQLHLHNQPILAAGIASILAFVHIDNCEFVEAAHICRLGLHVRETDQPNKAILFVNLHQASVSLALESCARALNYCNKAQQLVAASDTNSYEVLISQMMRGILHFELNELDLAWKNLESALDHIHLINGWVRIYAEGFSTAATIANLREGIESAEAVIRAGEALAQERNLPRLMRFMAIARLRELTRAGYYREADAWLSTSIMQDLITSISTQAYDWVPQVAALLEAARLMIKLGRPRLAQTLLNKINADFLVQADSRLRFDFHILSMNMAHSLRRYQLAVDHLHAAANIARHIGLTRRVIEVKDSILDVYDAALNAGRSVLLNVSEWIEMSLRQVANRTTADSQSLGSISSAPAAIGQNFMLSPRECAVIALMAEGLTNKEIARRLEITEGTIKTHRKKIYAKLEVSTRSNAIRRARELLII